MKISVEQVAAALITNGTVKATAEALNVTPKTIYNYMQDSEFIELYDNATAEIYGEAVSKFTMHLQNAVECMAEIMNDRGNNPQIRLQAAQSIIKNSLVMNEARERWRERAAEQAREAAAIWNI